ncbi:MAG: sensor histidine kinase [Bacteroidetes bacterium]|nr:MAG: sensor histidine kinase [Bacteroidota bacterium]
MKKMILLATSTATFLTFLLYSLAATAQYDKAYIDSIYTRLDTTKFDTIKMRCLLKIGLFYLHENPKKSSSYFDQAYALPLAYSPTEQGYRAVAACGISQVYEQTNNLPQAKVWLMKAYTHTQKTTDPLAIDKVYEQLSTYYRDNDRYDSALYFSQKMIQLWDSLKNPAKLPAAYYGMANLFQRLQQYQKANTYLLLTEKAIRQTKGDDAAELLSVYSTKAEIHALKREFDSCIFYSNLAYPIMVRETAVDDLGMLQSVKARAYIELHQYQNAQAAAQEAYQLAINNQQLSILPQICVSLAISKSFLGQKDSALWYANTAEKYFAAGNKSKEDEVSIYNMWAAVYTAQGNITKALYYKTKELEAYKQFKAEELSTITARSEVEFETAKKQATITNLETQAQQQKTIQSLIIGALILSSIIAILAYTSFRSKKKAAEMLEQSNREKEVFLKEIHHRVKNNLQIISSLLYMQFKDVNDGALLAKLKQAQDRIKSMALVHNKLYEKQDVVHVYLKEYIQDLATGVISSNTPLGTEIRVNIEEKTPIRLTLDTSISLGLIVNELITNSCKYAFQNKAAGTIHITLDQENTNYKLVVKDDGIGFTQGQAPTQTLGIRLVNNLARQLNGSAQFSNQQGTVATIVFSDAAAA